MLIVNKQHMPKEAYVNSRRDKRQFKRRKEKGNKRKMIKTAVANGGNLEKIITGRKQDPPEGGNIKK